MRKFQKIAAAAALLATLAGFAPVETGALDMARCPHAVRQVG